MRTLNLLSMLLIASPAVLAQPQSIVRKLGLTAAICFVQPEISGRMNVEESRISLSNYQRLALIGGQAACLYVYPGTYTFRIEFLNSEHMFGRRSKSAKYSVIVREGQRKFFEVDPNIKNGEYTGGWRAQPIQQDPDKQ